MISAFVLLIAGRLAQAEELTRSDGDTDATETRVTPFDLSLAGPVSLLGWLDPHKTVAGLDLNLAYSHAENQLGIAFGVANRVDRHAMGIEAQGILSIVDGDAEVIQVSGFYNRVSGDFAGIQATAGKNVLKGPGGWGYQMAGFKNETIGNFYGVQFAAGVNETSGMYFFGGQEAFMFNWSEAETFEGVQFSGLFNAAWGNMTGLQLSTVNYVGASERAPDSLFAGPTSFTGCQIGIVNIGGWVRGAQIGLINVASALTGVQIGALNFSKDGGLAFFPALNVGAANPRLQ